MWVRNILEVQGKSVLADTDEQQDFPKRKLEEEYRLGEHWQQRFTRIICAANTSTRVI